MCGGRSSILHCGSLIKPNNILAPTPNGNALINKRTFEHKSWQMLVFVCQPIHSVCGLNMEEILAFDGTPVKQNNICSALDLNMYELIVHLDE